MEPLNNFRVSIVRRINAEPLYNVYYKPGKNYCKRLRFEFYSRREADSVALYFQLWVDAGGAIRYTEEPDEHGLIISLDQKNMKDCPVHLTSQLMYLFHNGGTCPVQVAAFLMGMDVSKLEGMIAQHMLPYQTAGKIKLVRLDDICSTDQEVEPRSNLQHFKTVPAGDAVKLQKEYDRLEVLLPLLKALCRSTWGYVPSGRDGRIFLGFIHGEDYGALSKTWGLCKERIRQIVVKQAEEVDQIIKRVTTSGKELLQMKARSEHLATELALLRTEAKLVKARNMMSFKPDRQSLEWIKVICRLYNTPLSELGFSTRTYNTLESLSVKDIFDIARLDEETLRKTPGSGLKTVSEVASFRDRFELWKLNEPVFQRYAEYLAHVLVKEECEQLGNDMSCMDDMYNLWVQEDKLPLEPVPVPTAKAMEFSFPEKPSSLEIGMTNVQPE